MAPGPHEKHAAPPLPHAVALGVTQLPAQQPVGQVPALQPQLCPTHCWAPQSPHAAPPVPHAVALVPGRHTSFASQQPVGQVAAVQRQAPARHCWFTPHAAPEVPQLHAPLRQRSAVALGQLAHAPPSAPQLVAPIAPGSTQAPAEQHPVGHDCGVQVHVPLTQTSPAPHTLPLAPQRQTPDAQVSVVGGQVVHWLPAAPQRVASVAVTHWPPVQQPVGQLVTSHTQLPATQRWPAAHAAPAPQRQAPLAQPSAPAPQSTHAPPLLPHFAGLVLVMHCAPSQQPLVQLVASHTQALPTHRLPTPQAAAPPQVHAPLVQPSARVASQVAHTAPAVPQADAVGVAVHVPLRQQPVAQVITLQLVHCWPTQLAHCWQATPPVPHAAAAVPATHAPAASQQPVGQLVASHTHAPLSQRWPLPHAGLVPQRHSPPTQVLACVASHDAQLWPAAPQVLAVHGVQTWPGPQQPAAQLFSVHTHWPPTHAWPAAHGPPWAPHTQPPAVQRSVLSVWQSAHTAPPVPHRAVVGARQVPLKQQPVGQVVASQPEQVPPSQRDDAGHCWQRAPAAPHASGSTPGAQRSPSQQPAQLAGEHRGPPASRAPASAPPSSDPASSMPASRPASGASRATQRRATHVSSS